ncbi:MAG: dihydrofolate reductase [Hyphomicrobiales bacterium]|nr:dihydrofolate reductase [Hyphomicrobiales bacterium]
MGRPRIVLVVAVAENGVIGQGGALPWRLKSEMQRFRALTLGKPVIVGRKTYDSFTRKPLPGRTNIVVTRDCDLAIAGAVVTTNLDFALDAARGDALRRGVDAICVVGGADIYAQTMPLADRVVLTRVALRPKGDTTFPALDPTLWRETARSDYEPGPQDEAAYSIHVYERR